MDDAGTVIIISLCLFRIGIPLLITFLLTYLIDRFITKKSAAMANNMEDPGAAEPAPFFVPCWNMRDCPSEKHAQCQAISRPGVPCWLTMQLIDGHLSTDCLDCPVFHQTHVRTHHDSSV
jgi:hypothetical protein